MFGCMRICEGTAFACVGGRVCLSAFMHTFMNLCASVCVGV